MGTRICHADADINFRTETNMSHLTLVGDIIRVRHEPGAKRPGFIPTGKYPAINLLWLHRLGKRFKMFVHNIMYLISDIRKRNIKTIINTKEIT